MKYFLRNSKIILKSLHQYSFVPFNRLRLENFIRVILVSLQGFLSVFLLFIVFLTWRATDAASIITVSGRSEVTSVDVIAAADMAFSIRGAVLLSDGSCFNGEIRPSAGSTVSYERVSRGPLIVSVTHRNGRSAGSISGIDQQFMQLGPRFAIAINNIGCAGPVPVAREPIVLPLAGLVSVGADRARWIGGAPPVRLLEAKVRMYGRSGPNISELILLRRAALYDAGEVVLPAGSRIYRACSGESDCPRTPNENSIPEQPNGWVGSIFIDFSTEDRQSGFAFDISTNANFLDVFMPVPIERVASDYPAPSLPDRIHASLGSRLLRDPNIEWLLWILGVGFATLFALRQYSPQSENTDKQK